MVIPMLIANNLCDHLPCIKYWANYCKSVVLLMHSFCDMYNYSSHFMDVETETYVK